MKRLLSTCALAGVFLLGLSNTAFAAGSQPVRASHGDPFASCRAGAAPGSLNWHSAEVEPWIASNPANLSNLIGSWQQDRWSDGGAKGQVAAWSFNGGKSWGNTPQPFTVCAQPYYKSKVLQYERTSDPWQSIGPDGTAYAVSLPFDGDFVRNGLATAVSHDGGRTWGNQQDIDPLMARTDSFNPADDKESVTADPNRAGWAYVVWDQLQDIFGPCPPPGPRQAVRSAHDSRAQIRRASPTAGTTCPVDFTGPAYFARTMDGGKTWIKNPVPMVPTGPGEQTIGNQIVIDHHSGVLYDFFNLIVPVGGNNVENNVEMVFSTDQGSTWSHRQYVQRLDTTAEQRVPPPRCNCGVVYPGNESKPLRTGDIIPEPAIDPNTGQLYVIWQDGRPNNFQNDMLLASTSTGGGLTGTWSAPTLVNPPDDKAAFTAAIAVNPKGQVGVTYYDLTPPLSKPDVLLTDTWFAATAGPGLNFGPRQLIGGPYNMEAAPVARGWFVGDYMGLTALIPAPGRDDGDRRSGQSTGDEKGGDHQGSEHKGGNHQEGDGGTDFVALFVMTNCRNNSCRIPGSPDGTERGPDPTDAFSSRVLRPDGD